MHNVGCAQTQILGRYIWLIGNLVMYIVVDVAGGWTAE
jgi:hypothetical protein